MANAKDVQPNPTPSILLVGDGGSRKTRFVATCPKPFIYDFDAGTASIRGTDVEYETFKDAPFGVKVGPAQKKLGIYEWGTAWPAFVKHFNENVVSYIDKGEALPFLLYAFDSLTSMAMICMNYVLKESGKNGKDQPAIQHWGMQLRLLEVVMDQVTALPVPLVVTAHIRRDQNLLMETTEFLPLVGGQLSGKIGIYFDEVWYTKIETRTVGQKTEKYLTLLTESQGMYKQAKTRHNIPSGIVGHWSNVEPYFKGEEEKAA
jgi:hypothetical protein